MLKTTFFPSLWHVVKTHTVFSTVFTLSVLILLARIPLGTFNDSSILDTIAHFVLPATGTPLLYLALEKSNFLPSINYKAKILFMVLLGVGLAVAWEIFELGVDTLFGLNWQLDNIDTMTDLILGVAGSLLGSLVLLRYRKPQ